MTTYASKATAKKGAKRAGLEDFNLVENAEGRWMFHATAESNDKRNSEFLQEKTEGSAEGLKIEKDREEKNGVIRPSIGGKCRAIWDACDELDSKGVLPMPKIIKELAAENRWNINNAVIEMYQWRKFMGIIGRQK